MSDITTKPSNDTPTDTGPAAVVAGATHSMVDGPSTCPATEVFPNTHSADDELMNDNPYTTTKVPPFKLPDEGLHPVTITPSMNWKLNASDAIATLPSATEKLTAPVIPTAGVKHITWLDDTTCAGTDHDSPNTHAKELEFEKPEPVTITVVPPDDGPNDGLMPVTVGPEMYENVATPDPPTIEASTPSTNNVTFTNPLVWAGAMHDTSLVEMNIPGEDKESNTHK